MNKLEELILAGVRKSNYQPLKPKALARKLGVAATQYAEFRKSLRNLVKQGRLEMGKNHSVRSVASIGTISGTYRRTGTGVGYVRPVPIDDQTAKVAEIRISEGHELDAATGDLVLVKLTRKPTGHDGPAKGKVMRVLERAARNFVGTYFERDGQGFVRVDGTVFSHSIWVGDPGAKGAKPDDKVVFDMVRFPSSEERGEGVLTEVLGPRGQPGIDTLSIIRAYNLPDEFPNDALEEARDAAAAFREDDLDGREDFTKELVITIDPVDARDFDDAVSLTRDADTGHWQLTVHIADVGHFAPPGGALDREARKRATSVYLPQRVIPMFPEIISNHLASLQPDRRRYVKSVVVDFTPQGLKAHVRFANGVIRSRQRFAYEQVLAVLERPTPPEPSELDRDTYELLLRMRELALILRARRRKRGSLQLNMPEAELEYDDQGKLKGAHFRKDDISHQMIEEFMLTANEAVAEHLAALDVAFLRRIHPAPDSFKLSAFAAFARELGYKMATDTDRFALQRILETSADKPDVYAVHYALLRSLKQAVYSPSDEGHYALASDDYCHFTSPIRRYPDLTVHRQLGQWLRTGKAGGDETELATLGEHCSKMERRAEAAERELVKLKLLTFLEDRVGMEMEAIITGVADYGFFAQALTLPVEGMVHISTLADDYYYHEESTHTLTGRRSGQTYRLGDTVGVVVTRVDVQRRQLDFRVIAKKKVVETKVRPEEKRPRRKRDRGDGAE